MSHIKEIFSLIVIISALVFPVTNIVRAETTQAEINYDNADNRIVIVGAGHGGLLCAARLAENGYSVIVLEKKSRQELGWDWHDNFHIEIFDKVNLPRPMPANYWRINNFTFISPDNQTKLKTAIPLMDKEIAMDRKYLINMLVDYALEKKATILWNSEVTGPLLNSNNMVTGVIVNGKPLKASLVIDSAGVNSPVRMGLPESYKIKKEFHRGEIFYTYRAYYNLTGAKFDENEYLVYFGYEGRRGIVWIRPFDGMCDILIGQIDPLTQEDVEGVLSSLRKKHPELGDKLLRGGSFAKIPLRRPIDLFSGYNYTTIGDAAGFNVPVIGSGVENTLQGADILTATIVGLGKKNNYNGIYYTPEDLWNYQYQYYTKIGSRMCGMDLFKYYLLTVPWPQFDFLFRKGLLKTPDLENPVNGKDIVISGGDMLDRFSRGWYRPFMLLGLKSMLDDSKKATCFASAIPQRYDVKAIEEWQKQLSDLYTDYDEKLNRKK